MEKKGLLQKVEIMICTSRRTKGERGGKFYHHVNLARKAIFPLKHILLIKTISPVSNLAQLMVIKRGEKFKICNFVQYSPI